MTFRGRIVGLAALTLASPAWADADLKEQLSLPPFAALSSPKTPSELELCVADALGNSFLPVAFRTGPDDVVVFGFRGMMGAGTVRASVALTRTPAGSRVEIRTRDGGSNDGLLRDVKACL